jgi:hypothetical protein
MERNVLVGGLVLNTHPAGACYGEFCTIHNPSNHHMIKWKQDWLVHENYMVRICPHGQAHPDPDEINLKVPENHGCDGCCDPASQFINDVEELVKEYEKPDYLTPINTGVYMHTISEPIPGTMESLEKLLTNIKTTRHKGTDL